jgi:hypothetical protein
MKCSLAALLALPALLTAGTACAGVVIESATVDTRDGSSRPEQKLYVQDGHARVELPSESVGADYMIFKDDVLYVVEPDKKSYVALDRKTIQAVGGAINDAMSRVHEELAKLPPEQRAMVEQMMGQKAGALMNSGSASPPVSAVNTGRADEAAGRRCRVWELARDGEVFQELCVVEFSEVPGTEDLRTLAGRMNSLTEELSDTLSQIGVNPQDFEAMKDVDGYPVRIRDVVGGKPAARETVVTEWREASLPTTLFVVPEGYERRDLHTELERATDRSN